MFSTSQCKSYSLESYRQVKLCHKISFQEKKLQLTDYPTFLIELLKLTCTGSDFFQSELKSAQLLSSCQLFAVLHDSVVRQTNRNGNSNAKFNFFFFCTGSYNLGRHGLAALSIACHVWDLLRLRKRGVNSGRA